MRNDTILHTEDPAEYFANNFGTVVPFEIVKMQPDAFAEIFAEGSPALKKLLNKLWENDIKTIGCCVGHKDRKYYYKTNGKGHITPVDKKEYNWHRFSRHYHSMKEDASAYLALDPRSMKDPYVLGNEIITDLHNKAFPIKFTVGTQSNMVTVYLEQYVEPKERELFFNALSDTLDKFLLHEKDRSADLSTENKKTAFAEMLANAEQKAQYQSLQQKTHLKEYEHSFSK